MFPERMLKVQIITLKSHVEEIVAGLHKLGLVHIEFANGDEWIKSAPPLGKIEGLSREAGLVREVLAIAKAMGIEENGREGYKRDDLETIIGLQAQANELQRSIELLDRRGEPLSILKSLGINTLPQNDKVYYELFETTPEKVEIAAIACNKSDVDYEYRKERGRAHIFICGSGEDKESIKEIAKEHGLIPIKVERGAGETVGAQLKSIGDARAQAHSKLEALKSEIRERLSPILWSIRRNYNDLQVEIDRAEVVSKFGQSERLYFINGWVRERDRTAIEDFVASHGSYAIAAFSKPHHNELPPTSFKVSKGVMPFNSLLRFIAVPRSDEVDPTTLIAITLPMMYGMIVGDVGYALVLMALSYYLTGKTKGMLSDLMKITFISSFWGILWGIVFGEVFGFEPEWLRITLFGVSFPLISRLHGVINLFMLTIGLGAVHIALGNALGAIEGVKHKDTKHAIAKACWVLLEIGLLLLLFSPNAGIVLTLLSAGGVIATEGVIAVIEIPGMIANIMSYLRIAAVGLSGVILAFLINMMRPDPSQGVFMIVMFIVFAVAHFIAIVLAAFESLVQGGRLHAVEFFSKFFKGGGILFNPFRMKENIEVE